jgi:hypothetical protein
MNLQSPLPKQKNNTTSLRARAQSLGPGHFQKPVTTQRKKKKGQYVYRLLRTNSLMERAM